MIYNQRTIIALSLLLSIGIVMAAVVIRSSKPSPSKYTGPTQRTVTRAELLNADGKDGRPCYVAIDSNVYEISDSAFWKDGQHTTSAGQAYCGADMSATIDKSPHGRRILETLTMLGPLAQSD